MVKTGEWLSEAWAMVQQDLWTYVLLALIVALGNSITGGLLYGPLAAGFYLIVIRKLREPGYVPQVGDIGKGFEIFVPTFLAGLVGGIIAGLGGIACGVGAIVTTALVMFAVPLVADRGMDFWPAIMASIDKVKQNWLGFSLFVLVLGLVQMLGAIACVVGVFVTTPVVMVAIVLAYRDNFGLAGGVAPAAPQAPYVPPTPTEPPSPTPPSPTPPPSVPS